MTTKFEFYTQGCKKSVPLVPAVQGSKLKGKNIWGKEVFFFYLLLYISEGKFAIHSCCGTEKQIYLHMSICLHIIITLYMTLPRVSWNHSETSISMCPQSILIRFHKCIIVIRNFGRGSDAPNFTYVSCFHEKNHLEVKIVFGKFIYPEIWVIVFL